MLSEAPHGNLSSSAMACVESALYLQEHLLVLQHSAAAVVAPAAAAETELADCLQLQGPIPVSSEKHLLSSLVLSRHDH